MKYQSNKASMYVCMYVCNLPSCYLYDLYEDLETKEYSLSLSLSLSLSRSFFLSPFFLSLLH